MDIETQRLEALGVAQRIYDTMQTPGFADVWKILEDNISRLDTITGCTTFEELKARQVAVTALRGFERDLKAIGEALNSTRREEERKMPEPLIKRIKKSV